MADLGLKGVIDEAAARFDRLPRERASIATRLELDATDTQPTLLLEWEGSLTDDSPTLPIPMPSATRQHRTKLRVTTCTTDVEILSCRTLTQCIEAHDPFQPGAFLRREQDLRERRAARYRHH